MNKVSGSNKGKKSTRAHGDAGGIAGIGRAFDALGSPEETWDAMFEKLIGELNAAGHGTLQRKKRKLVSSVSRVFKALRHGPNFLGESNNLTLTCATPEAHENSSVTSCTTQPRLSRFRPVHSYCRLRIKQDTAIVRSFARTRVKGATQRGRTKRPSVGLVRRKRWAVMFNFLIDDAVYVLILMHNGVHMYKAYICD